MNVCCHSVARILCGVVLALGGGSILVNPSGAAFEMVETSLSWVGLNGQLLAAGVLGGVVCLEVALGLKLILRPTQRDVIWSGFLIAILSGVLFLNGSIRGWSVPCGCLEGVLNQSIYGGLSRNIAMGVLLWYSQHRCKYRGVQLMSGEYSGGMESPQVGGPPCKR